VLFLKDDDPKGANYYLFRDTVGGKQPTFWQFWTLSEKIGTPSEVRNRRAFLRDKPGNKNLPARRLQGDRFTALGQFGVDTEYYIAAPTDTPRHTMRVTYNYEYPIKDFDESQDMMGTQLPGDGHYFIAMFPRFPNEPVPTFSTLGDGKVIKVAGPWGTDYGFLSDKPAGASAEGASFTGTAGAVQDRKKGLVLSLAAKGEVRFKGYTIASDGPATLRVEKGKLAVDFHRYHKGQSVTVTAPGRWNLAPDTPSGVQWKGNTLTVPADVIRVVLLPA